MGWRLSRKRSRPNLRASTPISRYLIRLPEIYMENILYAARAIKASTTWISCDPPEVLRMKLTYLSKSRAILVLNLSNVLSCMLVSMMRCAREALQPHQRLSSCLFWWKMKPRIESSRVIQPESINSNTRLRLREYLVCSVPSFAPTQVLRDSPHIHEIS